MKKLIHILCVGIVLALVSCTNFVDEGAGLGGVKASVSLLSFSYSLSVQNFSVTSGEKWTVQQIPDWLRVSQISGRGYTWSVSLTSAENYGYDRTGVVTLQSSSSSAKIDVSQQGKLGAYVPVSSVSLSPQDLVITEGETRQMTATVYPSNASVKNVRWGTSSASVATVSSSGVVTAVAEGSATITATTEDGSYTATCRVTVKRRVINVTGVSLNKTSVTLTKGETSQLTATVSPSNATNPSVSWKSSSSSVATVSSSGLVKAVDGGTATITVTTEDGNYTATCKVTVKVPVTGVSLDKTDLSLTEGDTYQLSATVSPSNATNKTVSWESSATSVATVSSNGLITAKAEGSATITVTTEDGSKTATCRVTVKKKVISVTGVSLNTTSLTLTEGDTYQLAATVSPSNATNKNVKWQSNATGIATVSTSGLVTAITATGGTAAITVRTEDGGYTATCWVTVRPATGYENGHEWVDLGLPSGLKWAKCNVGANTPSDYGNYYAWGETSTKSNYDWSTYRYCNGTEYSFTKYNMDSSYGTVDNRTRLEMTDDAARANWGGSWRMPTDAEWTELRNNCNWTWTTQGGKNGYKVTSRTNGNSIFLPAAGYMSGSSLYKAGSYGNYWSSSLHSGIPYYAWYVHFVSGGVYRDDYYRCYGRSVRPVSE